MGAAESRVRGMIVLVWIGLALVCAGALQAHWTSAAEPDPDPRLRVLIITSDPAVGYAGGIETLLNKHGLPAQVVSWEQATVEFSEDFDVLVITGCGRNVDKVAARLDFTKPIVAYGPYGCKYLGLLHLKNGHPYT